MRPIHEPLLKEESFEKPKLEIQVSCFCENKRKHRRSSNGNFCSKLLEKYPGIIFCQLANGKYTVQEEELSYKVCTEEAGQDTGNKKLNIVLILIILA